MTPLYTSPFMYFDSRLVRCDVAQDRFHLPFFSFHLLHSFLNYLVLYLSHTLFVIIFQFPHPSFCFLGGLVLFLAVFIPFSYSF
jgi:hypothetical protein